MGGALLNGWLKAGLSREIVVIEPNRGALADHAAVNWLADAAQIPAGFTPDAVVLAVKPQVMDSVLAAYTSLAGKSLFLSIAAGRTLASYTKILGKNAAIVRAMPNLPASIGMGASAGLANTQTSPAQRALAEKILGVVGDFAWVEDESLIDIVTALSGSGPAYVFMLVEAMAAAGEKLGLPPGLSMRLARQTVVGTGAFLQSAKHSTAELCDDMTRIKGTTEAGVNQLMADETFAKLIFKAIEAASKRSRELAQ